MTRQNKVMPTRTIIESKGSFLVNLPKAYIENLEWEKGDKINVRLSNNSKLILEKATQ